jgi:molybdopterin converting factor small subunit
MPDCDYCGAAFRDEGAYHDHLRNEHRDELGPIDRRLVGVADEGSSLPVGPIALVAILGVTAALVGYVVFFTGGSSASGVGPAGSDHYHGTIEVTVLGEQVDFSRSAYQLRDDRFHFEGGQGTEWHAHASGVTLGYAMESLGFDLTRDSFTYQGTTYEDGAGYEVRIQVNDEAVGPDYVLQDGDRVRISVREG